MELSFDRLLLTNFKSFSGGPHVLDFGESPRGLCYVRGRNDSDPGLGSNGSGKSSLWDALTWCLYGKTVDSLRNPDIKPWFGGAQTIVQVDVIVDGDLYEVVRQTSPNRLRMNGRDVGQEEVEVVIGLNYDTFLNTILLGQGRDLFFDLDPSAKMQLFSDVLELGRWEERSKKASAAVSALDGEIQKVDLDIAGIKSRALQVKEDLKKNKERRDVWSDDNQRELYEVRDKLVEVEAQYDAFKITLAGHEVEEDMLTTQYHLSEKDSRAMFTELFEKRDKVTAAETAKRSLEKTISDFEEEIRDLGEADTCPTCGQSLEGTNLGAHKKELRYRIRQARKEIKDLGLDDLVEDYRAFQEKSNSLVDFLNEEEKKIKNLRSTVESWRRRCSESEVNVRSCKDKLQRLEEATNPYSKFVREGTAALRSLKEKLSEREEKKRELSATLRRTKYWVKGFKDIRLLITEQVLEELELVTTAMMQEVGLVGWYVRYTIEKETASGTIRRGLNLDIFNPAHGKPVKWKSWSGGEAQRMKIIGSLALAEVLLNHAGVITDMEILDEPIEHMGDEGVEDLCQLLADRSRQLERQIWYIDHHTREGSLFDAVVEVVKDENRASSISHR